VKLLPSIVRLLSRGSAGAVPGPVGEDELADAVLSHALTRSDPVSGLVPNAFVIELGDADYRRLHPGGPQLCERLSTVLRRAVDVEGWKLAGSVGIELEHEPALPAGRFRLRSNVSKDTTLEGGLLHRGGAVDDQLPAKVKDAHGVFPGNPRLAFSNGGYAAPDSPAAHGMGAAAALVKPVTVLGRDEGADIRLTDTTVAGRHAQVLVTDDEAWVEDLGSGNPTTLDGRRISSRVTIVAGQRLALGTSVLIFQRDA